MVVSGLGTSSYIPNGQGITDQITNVKETS